MLTSTLTKDWGLLTSWDCRGLASVGEGQVRGTAPVGRGRYSENHGSLVVRKASKARGDSVSRLGAAVTQGVKEAFKSEEMN